MIQITFIYEIIIYNVEEEKKMKKLFIPIISLLALGSLVGCGNKSESTISSSEGSSTAESSEESSSETVVDYSDLKIACPSGAPALAVYDMLDNQNVEVNANAQNVIGYISNNSQKDVVIVPTNVLVGDAIKNGAPFKIAGVITFGNFYLASTGNDDNNTLDKDDYIVIFQLPGLPGRLFKYTYGNDYTNLHNVASTVLAARCLETGVNDVDSQSVDYVLVAEPSLTSSLEAARANRPDKADNIKVIKNVQTDYETKSGNKSITQASIFVKATSDHNQRVKIGSFLYDVSKKLEAIKTNQDDLTTKLGALSTQEIATKFTATDLNDLKDSVARNAVGIGYEVAIDYKAHIDSFLKNLGFTSEDTSEELYW